MTWNAKPRGGYEYESDEAKENMLMIRDALSSEWTLYAIAGALGNIAHESAFNPWRWQSDTVNYNAGYGLVQFTPAIDYINGYTNTANLSTSTITEGASPDDGQHQCNVLINDGMGKWHDRADRNSWYDLSRFEHFSAFKNVDNLYDATMAFLYNYEGNRIVLYGTPEQQKEDFQIRYDTASYCYEVITGSPPTPPTPPDPPTPPTPTDRSSWGVFEYLGLLYR